MAPKSLAGVSLFIPHFGIRHSPGVPLVLHVFFPFRCEGFTTKGLEKKKHIAELKIRPS